MFLKKNSTKSGRILLTFCVGYRDNGKVKQKHVETLGYLDELEKLYDDPINHFKEIAKEKSNDEINTLVIKNLSSKIIDINSSKKNLGYIILKQLYNELGFKDFFNKKQSKINIEYNLNDIFELLIYSRILYPGSKKENFENKDRFFEPFNFSLNDLYRSLDYFNNFKEDIQTLLWEQTKESYNRNTSTTYYDCTNYYFEIEYNDNDSYDKLGNKINAGLRKRGPEKNKRPDPIVGLGLLMDNDGIPLSYDLFPGNESEKLFMLPTLKRTKAKYNIGRTIVVADRGLNTSDNIIFLAGTSLEQSKKMDGYVYGQSVRGADSEFKEWVLKQDYITDNFEENGENIIFIHKSRIYPKTIYVTRNDKGKTKSGSKIKEKILIDQKQMVYYSKKYANKQKYERELMINKAKDLINNPSHYNKATSYGSAAYINNLKFIKGTGEIAQASKLSLNEEKIKEEELYDGYYSIVSSEEHLNDYELRKIYKGLSKIEESFKITKTNLESRPVYVWTPEHIEAHFLTCFVSLVIIRLLEQKLNSKYSANKILYSLKNYTSTKIEHDIYLQDFFNECLIELSKIFNIDLSKKYLTLSQIKKFLNS